MSSTQTVAPEWIWKWGSGWRGHMTSAKCGKLISLNVY